MIPAPVQEAIGPLLSDLERLGLHVESSESSAESFGDFVVDLVGSRGRIRLVRDRSQYYLDGDIGALRAAGLLRAFDDVSSFAIAATAYGQSIV